MNNLKLCMNPTSSYEQLDLNETSENSNAENQHVF